jgi:hypothetical protein
MIGSENENELALDNVAGIRKTNPNRGRAEIRAKGGGRRAEDGDQE